MISKPVRIISDSDLIQACRKGEESAYRELVALHERQVWRTVMGMLGETAEAKDVSQETFVRFFRSLDSFQGKAKVSTFLIRIAINLSLNELKRRERKKRWLTFLNKDASTLNIEDSQANPKHFETKELVQKALLTLPPDFRSVVVLRLVDGYAVKEVAEILQIAEGTVCSRLARGQLKLKKILEELM